MGGQQLITSNIRTLDGSVYACALPLKEDLQEVQTLDECIFGGYTKCFKKYPFNDVLCNNYHLYAAEICLQAQYRGNKVYVCDIDLIHKSTGNADKRFIDGFYRLCVYYSGKIDYITTTIAKSSTKPIKREITYFKYLFKKSELFKKIKETTIYQDLRDEYKLNKFKKIWRNNNPNNNAIPVKLFNEEFVSVGDNTIGELNVLNNTRNRLIIGNNVTIGKNVTFLLGVEHNTNTISTYPFKVMALKWPVPESGSKGDIVVDDNVVIEDYSIILSNVHIGKNARILQGSVVSKDIPENIIVDGVPAKEINKNE